MKDVKYTAEQYANPSMLDARGGVGPYTVEEVRQMNGPVRHRKRRSTHKRRTLRMILTAQPWQYWTLTVVYAVCLLTVLLIVSGAVSAGGQR